MQSMVHIIKGKKVEELNLQIPQNKQITIELGCGDGRLLYKLAKNNPDNYFIGVDPNEKALEDVSAKSLKKPAKGGLDNLIFLKESAESLPDELADLASEILINFPWGSLLSGLIVSDQMILTNIVKIAKDNSYLEIFLTYHEKFEDSYIQERNLPELTLEFINQTLRNQYKEYGIILKDVRILDDSEKQNLQSTWAKKILSKRNREIFKIDCIINK